MPKKIAKSLEELDAKTNPAIVRQAKENARRQIALDKAKLAQFESKLKKSTT
ncbi:hypothetical protein ACJJIF_12270 [Microbulbifer sp. SSSA002]|uniref:hypothetical protein n=1 Tax=unclassified Microbulbifer TaxID=2619833 RepID=UPI00403946D9